MTPINFWPHQYAGHTDQANAEIKSLFETKVFDTPKPSLLIKRMMEHCCDSNDIVLDFFAGSGTTGQAAIDYNKDNDTNCSFILSQLPEKTDLSEYPTIAHITRERVRRVIAKLDQEDGSKKSTCGFRAFRLSSSNFRIWNADQAPDDAAKLAEQLQLHADNAGVARGEQDVLWELILKSGLPLSSTVAAAKIASGSAWSVDGGKLLISLDKKATRESLRAMIALKPQQMLCLDAAFAGDDALKTSIVLEARSHGVAFHTV